jgi:hypothetical protein
MPFANTKCAIKVAAASQGVIDPNELKQIFDNIDQHKDELSAAEISKQAVGKFLDQKQYQALSEKRTAIFNAISSKKIKSGLKNWEGKGLSPAKALEAYPLGTSGHAGVGTRNAAEPRRQSMIFKAVGALTTFHQAERLTSYIKNIKPFNRAIAEARWFHDLSPETQKTAKTPAMDKLSTDQRGDVMKIGKFWNAQRDGMRNIINLRGGMIGKLEGRGGAQIHNAAKIRNAANPKKWNFFNKTTEADHAAYVKDLVRLMDAGATRSALVKAGRMGVLENFDPQDFANRVADIFQGAERKPLKDSSGNAVSRAQPSRPSMTRSTAPAASTKITWRRSSISPTRRHPWNFLGRRVRRIL